jgi:diguanylate cyclase
VREQRIIESADKNNRDRRLFDRIGELLFQNGLTPSPENFELCHHYLMGGDSELTSLVDRMIRQHGGLTTSAIAAIAALRGTPLSADDLNRMTGDAQGVLDRIGAVVAQTGDHARDYGAALELEVAGLDSAESPERTIDTLMTLTRTMIEKARAAEGELRRADDEMKSLRAELAAAHQTANCDPLTGLPNRRAMDRHLRAALENSRRVKSPLTVAICDIDHFKIFNDTHGHMIGDEVIKFVASSLGRIANADTFVARYGGEEFVVISERIAPADIHKILDKVRAVIASRELKVTNTGQSLGKLSFSGGIAALDTRDSPGSILKRADDALYRAKQEGRNRLLIAE